MSIREGPRLPKNRRKRMKKRVPWLAEISRERNIGLGKRSDGATRNLDAGPLDSYVRRMKTVTTREFYHTPALVRGLRGGQSMLVTDNGTPAFVVTKAGKRSIKMADDLAREAAQICLPGRPKVDLTALMKKLKK